jgi:uncharacterized protein (DUF1697 family)
MAEYVAFLRGINVGGNNKIGMEELRQAFISLGFAGVKTVLASGNMIFETQKTKAGLAQDIEQKISKSFGIDVSVILRTIDDVKVLADADPFKNIKVTPQTRLYVTFLADKPKSKTPESQDKDFRILHVSDGEVFSVLTLSPDRRTVDLMKILEIEFGKKITTRNWNTVCRILKASQDKPSYSDIAERRKRKKE